MKSNGATSSIKPFFIDKFPVAQKIFRTFDPTCIQRIKNLCNNCPVTDITDSEKEKFCTLAGKRIPTDNELKKALKKKEEGFRCTADEEHIQASRSPKKPKLVSKESVPKNLFKGGTCEPQME